MAKISDNIIWLDKWEKTLREDEFAPASNEDIAFMLYAAKVYCMTGNKTNFKEVFNRPDLNKAMAPYYPQIDSIVNYRVDQGKNNKKQGNQSYDNERVKNLAMRGYTQKQICITLGYDESKSRSLSSNAGYRAGKAEFDQLSAAQKSALKSQATLEVEKLTKTDSENVELTETDSEMSLNQSVSFESENTQNQSVQSEVEKLTKTDDSSELGNGCEFDF